MTPDEIQLTDDLRSRLAQAQVDLYAAQQKSADLSRRASEMERTAGLLACQMTEFCRILRGGSMEHRRTET